MDKKILNIITLVAFVLCGANATFANINEDGFHVQTLSIDNSNKPDNTTSINMTNSKFPTLKEETKEENNYTLTPEYVYPQNNPYAYNNNYVQYRKVIGPYYTNGINNGFGFNYKGFGYNYSGHGYSYTNPIHNKRPIYVTPPTPLPQMKPHHGANHPHHNHHMRRY